MVRECVLLGSRNYGEASLELLRAGLSATGAGGGDRGDDRGDAAPCPCTWLTWITLSALHTDLLCQCCCAPGHRRGGSSAGFVLSTQRARATGCRASRSSPAEVRWGLRVPEAHPRCSGAPEWPPWQREPGATWGESCPLSAAGVTSHQPPSLCPDPLPVLPSCVPDSRGQTPPTEPLPCLVAAQGSVNAPWFHVHVPRSFGARGWGCGREHPSRP